MPVESAYATERPRIPLLTCVVLPELVLACTIALRPPGAIRFVAALCLLYTAFYVAPTYTVGTSPHNYGWGCAVYGGIVLNIMLLVTDPLKDIRYLKDPAPLTDKPLYKRIGYAFCIMYSARLIGTNAQVAHVPPPFKGTRPQFLRERLWQLLVAVITLDMAESWVYTHRHLYMASDSDSQHLYFPAGPLGYLARSACMAVWLMTTYSFLRMTHITLSIAAVATRLGDPDDWPDML